MKEYKLSIDPRILELLGPSLYTNIYYVLAELIANAYDADAHNVYVIANPDDITVEDDGHGMSYDDGDIEKYLNVAAASRVTEEQSFTRSGNRRRMGRKGVGKLAALSVSENVEVMTRCGKELSGFVLSRHPTDNNLLTPIPENRIRFTKVEGNGSAVVMRSPEYRLHKTLTAVKKNLLKIFPVVNNDFRIHVIRGEKKIIIGDFDRHVMGDLCSLITLGSAFDFLRSLVPRQHPERHAELVEGMAAVEIPVEMENTEGQKREYQLKIEGWIGAYSTTRGRKAEITDFPDNFISLIANKKMGEFNILPLVGQNKLNEVYVVGQLHVDLFELTELPDMALSNRQGYKSDDPRYLATLDYVRKTLLSDILRKRDFYADLVGAEKKKLKLEEQRQKEALLKANVDHFRNEVISRATKLISEKIGLSAKLPPESIERIIADSINDNVPDLGLKQQVDQAKRRILISQTRGDKPFADIIYQMLIHNRSPQEDILYTNCDHEISRIPEGMKVYEYLRDFFVESYSTEKIFVIFVTSRNTKKSWGALTEVGAGWITQVDNKIFNVHPFRPEHPLDDETEWQSTNREDSGELWMTSLDADIFCQKIEAVCDHLGYKTRSRMDNMQHLCTLVSVRDA